MPTLPERVAVIEEQQRWVREDVSEVKETVHNMGVSLTVLLEQTTGIGHRLSRMDLNGHTIGLKRLADARLDRLEPAVEPLLRIAAREAVLAELADERSDDDGAHRSLRRRYGFLNKATAFLAGSVASGGVYWVFGHIRWPW